CPRNYSRFSDHREEGHTKNFRTLVQMLTNKQNNLYCLLKVANHKTLQTYTCTLRVFILFALFLLSMDHLPAPNAARIMHPPSTANGMFHPGAVGVTNPIP